MFLVGCFLSDRAMQLNHGKFLDNGRYETEDYQLVTQASQKNVLYFI